jgi:hypothetical protein
MESLSSIGPAKTNLRTPMVLDPFFLLVQDTGSVQALSAFLSNIKILLPRCLAGLDWPEAVRPISSLCPFVLFVFIRQQLVRNNNGKLLGLPKECHYNKYFGLLHFKRWQSRKPPNFVNVRTVCVDISQIQSTVYAQLEGTAAYWDAAEPRYRG